MLQDAAARFTPPVQSAVDRARETGAVAARAQRSQDYALFKRTAWAFFQEPPFDNGHLRMRGLAEYRVSVGPDPALSGDAVEGPIAADGRIVEISYGPRRLSEFQSLSNQTLRIDWSETVEEGAALVYRQNDDGAVTVFLFPAKASTMAPEEDGIVLARYTDLEALTGRGVLEQHWRAFRAYAETTSIDGEPSWRDHLRAAWLKAARPTIVASRRRPPAIIAAAGKAATFAAGLIAAAAVIGVAA